MQMIVCFCILHTDNISIGSGNVFLVWLENQGEVGGLNQASLA